MYYLSICTNQKMNFVIKFINMFETSYIFLVIMYFYAILIKTILQNISYVWLKVYTFFGYFSNIADDIKEVSGKLTSAK